MIRAEHLRRCVVVPMALVLFACGGDSTTDRETAGSPAPQPALAKVSQSTETGFHTPPESASRPQVWATPVVPSFFKLGAGRSFAVRIDAPEDDMRGQTVDVYVSELGFDGWSVRRHLTTWTVDGPSTEIEVDPMTLPLRPVGSAAELRFDVEYHADGFDPETRLRIPSEAVSIAYAPDDKEAYIGNQRDVIAVEVASQVAVIKGSAEVGQIEELVAAATAGPGSARSKIVKYMERNLGQLQGNVVADDGTTYAIGHAPREGIHGSPESRGDHPAGSPLLTLPESWIKPQTVVPAAGPAPGVETKLVFFSWATTSFRDSDLGEKSLPGPNSTSLFPSRGRAPMSYAKVTGYTYGSTGAVDFNNGYEYRLNSAGFLVEEVRRSGMVVSFPHNNIADATRTVYVSGLNFNAPASGADGLVDLQRVSFADGSPVHVTMTRETPVTRTAAVVSTMLNVQGIHVPAEMRVYVGEGCRGAGLEARDEATGAIVPAEACVMDGAVFLGRNVRRGPNDERLIAPGDTTEEKFVIAHELGHALEYQSIGGAAGGVAYDKNLWDGELCGCGHVYGANNLHCLQSKMSQAGGYLEGFAHFVATAIMNPNNERAASFVYYKEVLRPHWNPQVGGNKRTLPPVKVKAGEPVGWQRQNCASGVQVNRSTEYDWMTFLWGIHQRETPGSIDYPTWVGIVKDGWCGGTNCTSQGTLTWSAVRANARAKFGSNTDPRMQRMDMVGFSSAVTEN